jgi:hypothetical protein
VFVNIISSSRVGIVANSVFWDRVKTNTTTVDGRAHSAHFGHVKSVCDQAMSVKKNSMVEED